MDKSQSGRPQGEFKLKTIKGVFDNQNNKHLSTMNKHKMKTGNIVG